MRFVSCFIAFSIALCSHYGYCQEERDQSECDEAAILEINLEATVVPIGGRGVRYSVTCANRSEQTLDLTLQAWIVQQKTQCAAGGFRVHCAAGRRFTKNFVLNANNGNATGGRLTRGTAKVVFHLKKDDVICDEEEKPITLVESERGEESRAGEIAPVRATIKVDGSVAWKNEKLRERAVYAQELARLREQGKSSRCVPIAEKKLAVERKVFGKAHEEVASTLKLLVGLYTELEDFDSAEKCLNELLTITEILHGEDNWRFAAVRVYLTDIQRVRGMDPFERARLKGAVQLGGTVDRAWRRGLWDDAVLLGRMRLKRLEENHWQNSRHYPQCLLALGEAYYALGDYDRAEESFRRASEAFKAVLGGNDPSVVTSLENLAVVYGSRGEHRRALPLFEEARRIRGERGWNRFVQSPAVVTDSPFPLITRLNEILMTRKDYEAAKQNARLAISIAENVYGETHWKTTNVRLALDEIERRSRLTKEEISLQDRGVRLYLQAQQRQRMGLPKEALSLLQEALKILERVIGRDHEKYVAALDHLGTLHMELKDFTAMLGVVEEGLRITEDRFGEEHPYYARQIGNLAAAHRFMENYPRSKSLYEKSLEIMGGSLGQENAEFVANLIGFAEVCVATGDHADAEGLLQKALAITLKFTGDGSPDREVWLRRVASAYQAMGRNLRASVLYETAVAIQKTALGEEHLDYATSLATLSSLYGEMGNYARAALLWQEALEIRERVFGKENADHVRNLSSLGEIHRLMGNYTEAERLSKEALGITKRARLDGYPVHSFVLNNLGGCYLSMGYYARAEARLNEALEVLGQTDREEDQYYAIITNLGALYEKMGDYARAERRWKEALEITKGAARKNSDYARSLNNLGMLYVSMGDYVRAEDLLRQALKTLEGLYGVEHPSYASTLNNLGMLYLSMGNLDQAERLLSEALRITQKALGKEHPDYGQSLFNLSQLFMSTGDYAQADSRAEEGLRILESTLGREHPDYAAALTSVGGLYRSMGNYARAQHFLQDALEIAKQTVGKEHPTYIAGLGRLGALYAEMGDYARAEPLLRSAVRIATDTGRVRNPEYAGILNQFVELHLSMGDSARAEPLLTDALAILKETRGIEHPAYATGLHNLGVLYRDSGDYARAEPLLTDALAILKETRGEQHPEYAAALANVGVLYREMGKYGGAVRPLSEALAIKKSTLGGTHASYGRDLHNLGLVYQLMGDSARAAPFYELALDVARKSFGEQHPFYSRVLTTLGDLHLHTADYDGAKRYLQQALDIWRQNLERFSIIQSERQQLLAASSGAAAFHLYLSLAASGEASAHEAYRHVLMWKGAVFSRQRAVRLMRTRPELAPLFSELELNAGHLAALAFSVPPSAERHAAWTRQFARLTHRREELEKQLFTRRADDNQDRAVSTMAFEDVQSFLPRDAVLIDFVLYGRSKIHGSSRRDSKRAGNGPTRWEPHLAAFVVRPAAPIVQIDLGPWIPVADAVVAWRNVISGGGELTRSPKTSRPSEPGPPTENPAVELRDRIWKPLEAYLAGARIVLVSPDGALGAFPFEALPGKRPGSYVLEETPIALVPVPQLLPELLRGGARATDRQTEQRNAPVAGASSLLLVGDVDFDGNPSGAALATSKRPAGRFRGHAPRRGPFLKFDRLPYTRGEIDRIRRSFEKSFTKESVSELRGADALEAVFRKEVTHSRFVHLATHGFFAPQVLKVAVTSSPDLSLENRLYSLGARVNVVGWHPGLLSGIVLAGANRKPDPDQDDGILTALELATLDLAGTELLVLSACETGLGAIHGGEGLLGLQRAAQVAGAATVVASLWRVEDREAQALMVRFYENLWEKGLSNLEALRQAQLAVLRGEIGRPATSDTGSNSVKPYRAPPRAWAAWVLSGDWR